MKNPSNDHLFRLINSLSRAEKRYFKLYTSRHLVGNHSNHQVLFDAVAKMKEYDEAALLKKFEGEAFTRRFPIAKRRLYDMILKSLDAFHAESSLETRMRRSMHQVEILFKKGLYKDAGKILRSIRRTAIEKQLDTLLIDVKIWERKLMERSNYAELKEGELEAAGMEMNEILQRLKHNGRLWELKSTLFNLLYKKGQARSEERIQELDEFIQDVALTSEPDDPKGKYLFHHIHGVHNFAVGDLGSCRDHLRSELDVLTSESEYFAEEPNMVVAAMSNLIHVSLQLGDEDEAIALLQRFRGLPDELKMDMTEDLRLRMFATTTSLEFSVGMQRGEFSKLVDKMDEISDGLDTYGERLGTVRKAGLYYSIAFTHFATGDMSAALKWCNRLLNDIHIDKSEDIICFGHLLNLLIHLEAGHSGLLPYALRSAERFLKTRERVFQFETLFLDMVRSLAKAKGKEREEDALQRFIDSAISLRQDPLEKPVFEHLHPISWAISKLQGTSLEAAMKSSAQAA